MNNTNDASLYEKKCSKLLKNWKDNKEHPLVENVLSHFKENKINPRRIKNVHWCGVNGQMEKIIREDPKGNPSDILIEFGNGEFYGISLKRRVKSSTITYKNPGLGTIGNYLGYDYSFIHDNYEKIIVDHFGLPSCQKDRKNILKENAELKQAVDLQGYIMLQLLLVHPEWGLKTRYEQMPHKKNVDHILSLWMNAKDPVVPYLVITEKNGKYSRIDPMKSNRREKLLKSKKLYWGVNGTSLTVDLKTLNIMAMRIKYTSQKFASSIKFSGEFT